MTKVNVLDTCVPIFHPDAPTIIKQKGEISAIPFITQFVELDKLKDEPATSFDARAAIDVIYKATQENDPSLMICKRPTKAKYFEGLIREKNDHEIVATTRMLIDEIRKGFYDGLSRDTEVVLVTRDKNVRILAKTLGIPTEDYTYDRVDNVQFEMPKSIQVDFCSDKIKTFCPQFIKARPKKENNKGFKEKFKKDEKQEQREAALYFMENVIYTFPYEKSVHGEIKQNEGVVCVTNKDGEDWKESFAAVRKGDYFRSIPMGISAAGIKPYTMNGGGPNWSHFLALHYLLDPTVHLVLLQGPAGTGKTLFAVAAAIEQRESFKHIIVTRPPVHFGGKDRLGYLKGDLKEKLSHWMQPIEQSLDYIAAFNEKNHNEEYKKIVQNIRATNKVTYLAIDMIKGQTYHGDYIIVDESQDLTPSHTKALTTRPGIQSKMVYTGDIGQIEPSARIDKNNSGLTHLFSRFINNKDATDAHLRVAAVNFGETVRSELAQLAEKYL